MPIATLILGSNPISNKRIAIELCPPSDNNNKINSEDREAKVKNHAMALEPY
jgi:hypothetical protein